MPPHDVKVDVRLACKMDNSDLSSSQVIQKSHLIGFKKANITDAVNKANSLIHLCENPFQEKNIVTE